MAARSSNRAGSALLADFALRRCPCRSAFRLAQGRPEPHDPRDRPHLAISAASTFSPAGHAPGGELLFGWRYGVVRPSSFARYVGPSRHRFLDVLAVRLPPRCISFEESDERGRFDQSLSSQAYRFEFAFSEQTIRAAPAATEDCRGVVDCLKRLVPPGDAACLGRVSHSAARRVCTDRGEFIKRGFGFNDGAHLTETFAKAPLFSGWRFR